MANKRYIEVVTSSSCSHCRAYVQELSKYIQVIEYDVLQGVRKVKAVPYSFLYVDGTLVNEWLGNDIRPLFKEVEEVKVKFTRECQDKYTGEIYKENSVKEFPKERAEELIQLKVAKNDKDTDTEESPDDSRTR